MEKLPVLFRAAKAHNPEITAVFPTLEAGPGEMTCYAHIGQHGACALEWYYMHTRPAKPHEYAPLLRELRGIYERGPDPVELVVYKQMTGKAALR